MANTIDWGKATQNNTNGFGKYQNTINAGSIYGDSYAGETAIVGTSASFLYSKSSYNQGESDPTPTITGTAGGSFNASANVVFVDTGTFNSSTGQIDLSATGIGSHIITYTVDGVQSGQTVGVTAIPYASTSSFTFDGINDYFDAGNPTGLQFTGAFSVSFWMKSNATGNRAMVSKDNNASNPRAFSIERTNSVSGGYFVVYDGTTAYGVYITSSDANYVNLNDNNWHNVVGVYTPSTSVSLFVDGNFIKSNTTNIPASVNFVNDNLNIGRRTQGTNYFSGNLDEVSIWNTALSSDAVTEIYNSGAPNDLTSLTNASNTNLKAWYKF